jgi:hypothetical protein
VTRTVVSPYLIILDLRSVGSDAIVAFPPRSCRGSRAGLIFRKAGKWHGDILMVSWIIEGLDTTLGRRALHSHPGTFLSLDRSRARRSNRWSLIFYGKNIAISKSCFLFSNRS